jgi:hypothetical protein
MGGGVDILSCVTALIFLQMKGPAMRCAFAVPSSCHNSLAFVFWQLLTSSFVLLSFDNNNTQEEIGHKRKTRSGFIAVAYHVVILDLIDTNLQ